MGGRETQETLRRDEKIDWETPDDLFQPEKATPRLPTSFSARKGVPETRESLRRDKKTDPETPDDLFWLE